jgi:pimeloyl-ACP methyl ester carboxylesterase
VVPAIEGGRQTAFESGDFTLTGELFGTTKGQAALLVPGSRSDMTSLFALAQKLASDGAVVLTFDFRGYGQSDGDRDPSTYAADVSAALRFLKERGNGPVAVVGVEGGGTAAVIAAAGAAADVAAVVAIGSAPTFGPLDAHDAARTLHAQAVVFSSGSDGGDQLAGLISGAELRRSAQAPDPTHDEALQNDIVAFVTHALGITE